MIEFFLLKCPGLEVSTVCNCGCGFWNLCGCCRCGFEVVYRPFFDCGSFLVLNQIRLVFFSFQFRRGWDFVVVFFFPNVRVRNFPPCPIAVAASGICVDAAGVALKCHLKAKSGHHLLTKCRKSDLVVKCHLKAKCAHPWLSVRR